MKKRRNLLATLAEEATLKVVTNSLFSNPLMPSERGMGIIGTKTNLSILTVKIFSLA
jgi:hypothetical protein